MNYYQRDSKSKKPSIYLYFFKGIKVETKVIELDQGIKLEMILILGGSFEMGSPKNEKNRFYDERVHDVTLTNSFYIGKHQMKQDVWEHGNGL